MKMLRRWLSVVAAAALVLSAPQAARAMDARSCDDPRVFRDSPVNVIVLPYTYTGREADRPLSEAARRLTVLIQQDSLIEMVKYERIAIVNLIETGRRCEAEQVWDRMAGDARNRERGAQSGGGVVMLWGRLFEEGGSLFIQSYLRFARVDAEERIERTIKGISFRAALPHDTVATPPRRVSRDDLRAITDAFERAAQVRAQPDPYAPVVRVSPDPNRFEPFGYAVTDVRGDWMRVESLYGGPPGWIRARVDAPSLPLRDRLPELYFLDATVGYLQYRVATESARFRRDAPVRFVGLAERSFARYLEAAPRGSAPAVAALGNAMVGALHLLRAGGSRGEALEAAQSRFAAAVRLAPYSGDLRNLAALARLTACCADGSVADASQLLELLNAAVAADPENRTALANLAGFHRLLDAAPVTINVNREEIARQRSALKAAGAL